MDPAAPKVAKPARKPRTIAGEKAKANLLIREATELKPGERMCKAKVKIREDLTRPAGPDNPFLRNDDGTVQTRPCKNFPISGGTVCHKHGGRAPAVKRKAEKRLLAMVEPALVRLGGLAQQEEHLPTALGAIQVILQRAGSSTAIGPLAKDVGDKDSRPIININIKPGGLEKPVVAIGVQQVLVSPGDIEGEMVERDDEDDA
jgi:hypothetical protein